jgi:flavin reductase (DIM6/NTAB) family NADH-FMN oxidoreductase RutF
MGAPAAMEITDFTHKQLRRALGRFTTGVTVVTTSGRAGDDGMTANSFTSVSLTPPLVLVCAQRESRTRAAIEQNGVFAINVLAAGQEDLATRFADSGRPRGASAFAGLGPRSTRTRCPLLRGASAHFDCRLVRIYPAGDHVILLGHVKGIAFHPRVAPLVFHGGRYGAIAAECAPAESPIRPYAVAAA